MNTPATQSDPGMREKDVPIARGTTVSAHIVDLSPAPDRRGPLKLNLEQRFELFVIWLKKTLTPWAALDEHRRMSPRRPEPPQDAVRIRTEIAAPNLAPKPALMSKPAPRPPVMQLLKQAPVKPAAPRMHHAPVIKTMQRPFAPLRQAASFAGIALAILVPMFAGLTLYRLVKGSDSVPVLTRAALSELGAAGASAAELAPQTGADFDRAASSFADTRARLRDASLAVAALATGQSETLKSGDRVLHAGELLSKAGAEVSGAFDALDGSSDASIPARVKALSSALAAAEPDLAEASSELDAVPLATLPKEYRSVFSNARDGLRLAAGDVQRFTDSSAAVLDMLGASGKRRYLVLFENDHELRPTGGFIGSFALMDVEDGKIVNMEIPAGGSYDLRAGLNERLAAPSQLRLVNTRWEFQDANWFADFPTSAQALEWFYEKSGGPTIDGVVAITGSFMEDLLKQIGPVDLPEYGKTVTADNFFDETQKAVEIDYDRTTNKPKQFISDLAPKVLSKLMDGGQPHLASLMGAVSQGLVRKDVQFWFRDQDQQKLASSFGWTGELAPPDGADFLAVSDTNIAGGKTDGVIDEDVSHEMTIGTDGSIVDTVTVRRTHNGKAGDLFSGIKNIDYMRFYVPTGSELLSADGFQAPADGYFQKPDETLKPSPLLAAIEGERRTDAKTGTDITSESGLTVFGNWIQIEPGESRTVRVSYRLPFTLGSLTRDPKTRMEQVLAAVGAFVPTANLKLVVRKQPGASHRTLTSTIRLPAGWSVSSFVPEQATAAGDGLRYQAPLDGDAYIGAVLAKNH